MKASEFDEKFDRAEDITEMLDIKKAKRSSQDLKRVNVDIPLWMVELLDQEAKRLGVTRQSTSRCGWPNGLRKLLANPEVRSHSKNFATAATTNEW